jgi:hypothetical protein
MKRIYTILLSLAFVFSFSFNTFAQKDDVEDVLIVLPAQSISKFVTRLLPYEINTAKIGKQVSSLSFGNVNLLNDWVSSFRFDADRKVLYIKPHLKNQVVTKKASQKEILINTLFKVLSDIEYSIDLREINPITTEFLGKFLTINFEISNIYAVNNKLTVKFRPIPHISDKKKIPEEKTP